MIEVEQGGVVAQLAQDAGKTAATGGGKVDQVADLVVGARHRVFVQGGARDRSHQVRVALAEAFAGGQLERGVRAFRQAQQTLFQERRQLVLPQHQGRGISIEGSDNISTVQRGKTIMQGEVSLFGNDSWLLVGHSDVFR